MFIDNNYKKEKSEKEKNPQQRQQEKPPKSKENHPQQEKHQHERKIKIKEKKTLTRHAIIKAHLNNACPQSRNQIEPQWRRVRELNAGIITRIMGVMIRIGDLVGK